MTPKQSGARHTPGDSTPQVELKACPLDPEKVEQAAMLLVDLHPLLHHDGARRIVEDANNISLREATAEFLIARIDDLDWCGDMEDFANNWNAHVDPPLSRLRSLIQKEEGK